MLRVGHRTLLINNEPRLPGDPIPEAASWPNLRAYVDTGQIVHDDKTLRVGAWPITMGDQVRQPGALIPEAQAWPNLQAYIETGRIVLHDSDSSEPSGGSPPPASTRLPPSQPMRRRHAPTS